ncbi:MAG: SRPBCC family protein [Anaerolineae bacterium]|nr:SRPBCC family protein [Gemmatimonadaceae bacterium]
MLMKMLFGLVVVVLVLVMAIMTRPATFRVQRMATISAAADRVFGFVNDFRRWTAWSPWEKLDPNLKRTFSGNPSGVGSVYSWAGNSKAGEGRMAIKESIPNQRVAIDLQFLKPFKARNLTEFMFKPTPEGVNVTWTMSGDSTFATKAISLFSSMDKMVGKDFEQGLVNLKNVAEAETGSLTAGGSANA